MYSEMWEWLRVVDSGMDTIKYKSMPVEECAI